MVDIPALTDFNLVASHGGFGRAARASGRPKASLSRHVRDLEESLGLRLLERDSRVFRLTEDGRRCMPAPRGYWPRSPKRRRRWPMIAAPRAANCGSAAR
jgi:DNA-binding transcriptional LysR family regulator